MFRIKLRTFCLQTPFNYYYTESFFLTAAVSTQHRNKAIPKCNNIKQLLHKKLFYSHIVSFFFQNNRKATTTKKKKIMLGYETLERLLLVLHQTKIHRLSHRNALRKVNQ